MKTSSKKVKECKVPVTVELDGEEVKSVVDKIEKKFLNNSRIDGFRVGKAPLNLVRKVYGETIEQEINSAIITENIRKAIENENLKAINVAEIKDFKRDSNGASWSMEVEVEPEFELPEYKGLKIAPINAEISDKELDEEINTYREAYCTYEEAKEGDVAADGDFVEIDFEGKIDGKSVGEVCAEAKTLSEGKGFWVKMGSMYFIGDVIEALKGMKVGEKKENIEVVFKKETEPTLVAIHGKKALYNVEVKAIRKYKALSDEDFLKRIKMESIEQFRDEYRKIMKSRKEASEQSRRDNEVSEALVAKCDFDVPQSVINHYKASIIEEYSKRAKYSGISPEAITEHLEEVKKDVDTQAIKRARLFYVLQRIAEKENIDTKDNSFVSKVYEKVLSYAK